MYIINSKKSCQTPIWGVVPPIPELTSGRKVKGTEILTRGHTIKEIGTSLMTGCIINVTTHERMCGCCVAVPHG